MKPLLVSSGEPAGIGPDICLALKNCHEPLVVMADRGMLAERVLSLGLSVDLMDYDPSSEFVKKPDSLWVYHVPLIVPVIPGQLDPKNADYVLRLLAEGTDACLRGEFSGFVTAPVHKAIINAAGISFTGHTEFLANRCGVDTVVMMLACDAMKVALVTTHLPLKEVASAINRPLLRNIIQQLNVTLQRDFGVTVPRITVAGLNPHAGEGGYMGREEIDIISPVLRELEQEGLSLTGPLPADTMFTPQYLKTTDVFLTMYHDQGLPVLKYAGFGNAVNITLGLPIIRTSVDHGTALELAGSGSADHGSLLAAVRMANFMSTMRAQNEKN